MTRKCREMQRTWTTISSGDAWRKFGAAERFIRARPCRRHTHRLHGRHTQNSVGQNSVTGRRTDAPAVGWTEPNSARHRNFPTTPTRTHTPTLTHTHTHTHSDAQQIERPQWCGRRGFATQRRASDWAAALLPPPLRADTRPTLKANGGRHDVRVRRISVRPTRRLAPTLQPYSVASFRKKRKNHPVWVRRRRVRPTRPLASTAPPVGSSRTTLPSVRPPFSLVETGSRQINQKKK